MSFHSKALTQGSLKIEEGLALHHEDRFPFIAALASDNKLTVGKTREVREGATVRRNLAPARRHSSAILVNQELMQLLKI